MASIETTTSTPLPFPDVLIGDWIIYDGRVLIKVSNDEAFDVQGRKLIKPTGSVEVRKTATIRL